MHRQANATTPLGLVVLARGPLPHDAPWVLATANSKPLVYEQQQADPCPLQPHLLALLSGRFFL